MNLSGALQYLGDDSCPFASRAYWVLKALGEHSLWDVPLPHAYEVPPDLREAGKGKLLSRTAFDWSWTDQLFVEDSDADWDWSEISDMLLSPVEIRQEFWMVCEGLDLGPCGEGDKCVADALAVFDEGLRARPRCLDHAEHSCNLLRNYRGRVGLLGPNPRRKDWSWWLLPRP